VLTCEQVDGWFESLESLAKKQAGYADAIQLLLTHITDWDKFPEPFSADAMKRHLTMREVWTLTRELPAMVGMQENELGKSGSPLLTVGVASAEAVPTDATTSQPNANQS